MGRYDGDQNSLAAASRSPRAIPLSCALKLRTASAVIDREVSPHRTVVSRGGARLQADTNLTQRSKGRRIIALGRPSVDRSKPVMSSTGKTGHFLTGDRDE